MGLGSSATCLGDLLISWAVCPIALDDLRRGICHLWWWRPDASPSEILAQRGIALLSDDELARYRRYLVPHAAQTFLAARVFLRSVLSAYCAIAPADWRFETNPWGRPRIATASAPAGLTFNLSHKPGCVACLIGHGRTVGVDVEHTAADRPHVLELAGRFFSPSEAAALNALPVERQFDRFYELWTLKESYIKARGMGLSLGLSRFSFAPDGSTANVRFDPGFHDDPAAWDFRLFRPDPQHVIATAVERLAGSSPTIEIRNAADPIMRVLA
jgi:4'-phosphopantetheinyl transferase